MDNVTIFNMRKTINIKFRTYGQNVTIFNIRKTINIKFRTYGQNVTIFNIRKTIDIKFRTYGHYVKYTYGSRQFCKEGGGPYLRGFRIFFQRGVLAQRPQNSLDNVFLVLSLFTFYRGDPMVLLIIFFQGSRGGPTFSRGGGGHLFHWWSKCIETHITCDFPGGGGPPISLPPPPQDPNMSFFFLSFLTST